MEERLLENHKRYLERMNFYKDFGYDVEKERKFILEKSYPLFGDILEVGTGKGYFTVELAREGYDFVSVDVSSEEQEFARLNIKYFGFEKFVDFRIENAESLSFGNSSFDIVFSINTVHHLTNPVKVTEELIRITTPEGKIVLSDFTEDGLKIIDKIHASEGKVHEAGRISLSNVGDYLEERRFGVERHRDKFQEVLIAYHQIV
ncbi:MAG: class I SAM-dependent methyltransferase [Candidatus Omnitrophica bacterium]|nr:class I SAM-dependent methyltransferase [Candidatus Omnitrophota bacterium]